MHANTDAQVLDWMRLQAKLVQGRRDWSNLPKEYEIQAVAAVFQQIKPHFDKRDIKVRIRASKATTFVELLNALRPEFY